MENENIPVQPDEDRRFHSRIEFDAPVVVSTASTQWQCNLLDISLKGALVKKPENWEDVAGRTAPLNIELAGSELHILMEASVMHVDEDQVGFHCDHIDLDSITNLRHLVELSLGDESLLDRELAALL